MSWLDTLEEIRAKDWTEASDQERAQASKDVVNMSSYAAAAASMVPVPLAEMAILIPIHSTMVMTLGHISGRPITKTEAKRVVLELGAIAGLSLAGRAAVSALKKLLLPGIGSFLAAPMTFAVTWGLGQVSVAYFANPHLSQDELKQIFQDAVKDGKAAFSMETLEKFRKDDDEPVSPGPDDAGEPSPAEPAPEKRDPAPPWEEPDDLDARKKASESLRPKKRSM